MALSRGKLLYLKQVAAVAAEVQRKAREEAEALSAPKPTKSKRKKRRS